MRRQRPAVVRDEGRGVSEHVDHYAPVPLRFVDALNEGVLEPAHVLVGVLVAARCYEVRNTAGGVATIRLSTLAELCKVSDDKISRKLDDLRERGWIDFERPKPGQRIGWRIWLTELAPSHLRSEPPPQHLRTTSAKDPPSVRSSTSADLPGGDTAIPHGDRGRTSAPAPHDAFAVLTNDTRRDQKRTISEQNYDQVVGETTAAALEEVSFLDAVAGAAADAFEREREFLADCQARVDRGEARWIEGSRE
jgi:hypothetical protein